MHGYRCPKCGENKFHATAHIAQGWLIGGRREWLETTEECSHVSREPSGDDQWECANCHHEATGKSMRENTDSMLVNLIIIDRNEDSAMTAVFRAAENNTNPEESLRNAIRDFIESGSDEAEKALEHSCGNFNWGDAICRVPELYYRKHGLEFSGETYTDVVVDRCETLSE